MKKILTRLAFAAGTLGVVAAGAAAFSAFEAHVVNVTATIENALTVPQELNGLSFGTIFPEEVAHKTLNVSLSSSFLNESRVDDVSYMIRQKPKCMATDPQAEKQFAQVTDGPNGTFVCPEGYSQLPLLCPYLSKHLVKDRCDVNAKQGDENACYGIDAFHGDINNWTLGTTVATQVLGHIVKGQDPTTDTWDIDLHAPCFKGQCAQDNVIPASYQPDPKLEGKMFGCDLWVEVTGISLPEEGGHLTVVKHVVGTSTPASAFSVNVSGINANPSNFAGSEGGTLVAMAAGAYTVTEGSHNGFTVEYSADCAGNMTAGGNETCTITNTWVQPTTGQLTVIKHVVGSNVDPNSFTLMVDGSQVTNGVATTVPAGVHLVSEVADSNYITSFGGNCVEGGNVTVPAGGSATCDVTNTLKGGTLTVHKIVENPGNLPNVHSASEFNVTIDNNNVAKDTAIPVAAGNHNVSEQDSMGYVKSYSGACDASGNVTVGPNEDKVCTITNTVPFGTITVTKSVTNNNGGTKQIPDFTLKVNSTVVSSGVSKNFAPGTYTVSETGAIGYAATFSGQCDPSTHTITIGAGENKSCSINNDDIAPVISLIKNVINSNGGTAQASDFIMRVDGDAVPTESSVQVLANTNHTITEDAKVGYHFVSITGAGCPASLGTNFQLTPGTNIICTITNQDN